MRGSRVRSRGMGADGRGHRELDALAGCAAGFRSLEAAGRTDLLGSRRVDERVGCESL